MFVDKFSAKTLALKNFIPELVVSFQFDTLHCLPRFCRSFYPMRTGSSFWAHTRSTREFSALSLVGISPTCLATRRSQPLQCSLSPSVPRGHKLGLRKRCTMLTCSTKKIILVGLIRDLNQCLLNFNIIFSRRFMEIPDIILTRFTVISAIFLSLQTHSSFLN